MVIDNLNPIDSYSSGGGTGEVSSQNIIYVAGEFDYPASDLAPLNTRTLTNGEIQEHLHDDTTNESVTGQFKINPDIDTAGTVTFRWIGSPATAAAGKKVVYALRHSFSASGDIDVAYTAVPSAATAMSATQDAYNMITWTKTVSTLGWTANGIVRFMLERDAAGTYVAGDDLVGDCATWILHIEIPRA